MQHVLWCRANLALWWALSFQLQHLGGRGRQTPVSFNLTCSMCSELQVNQDYTVRPCLKTKKQTRAAITLKLTIVLPCPLILSPSPSPRDQSHQFSFCRPCVSHLRAFAHKVLPAVACPSIGEKAVMGALLNAHRPSDAH